RRHAARAVRRSSARRRAGRHRPRGAPDAALRNGARDAHLALRLLVVAPRARSRAPRRRAGARDLRAARLRALRGRVPARQGRPAAGRPDARSGDQPRHPGPLAGALSGASPPGPCGRMSGDTLLDLLVVGAGPTALSIGADARAAGMDVLLVERGALTQ